MPLVCLSQLPTPFWIKLLLATSNPFLRIPAMSLSISAKFGPADPDPNPALVFCLELLPENAERLPNPTLGFSSSSLQKIKCLWFRF